MENINGMQSLYNIIQQRKASPEEGSYTCYLFDSGIDKILKKCAEENGEMIIAAKNNDSEELANEMCDLLYHMLVLMVEQGVPFEKVMGILDERSQKIGNLKQFKNTDHNT